MELFGRDHRQLKSYRAGTHRTRSPSDTLADYMRFMPEMGITRLANVTGLDVIGLPVYMGIRPNSRNLSVSQGKGLDNDAAKASALMESIETWHAESLLHVLRYESQAVLRRSAHTLDVRQLTRVAHAVVSPSSPRLWIEGYDLLQQRPILVPQEMVCLNFVDAPGQVPALARGSNGLASGNHLLEAVSHALCELIERDATALWHIDDSDSSAKATQLDLATIADPGCRTMIDLLAAADVGIGAWDVTSDLGIPTYACTIFDRPGVRITGIFNGYGCHLSPAIALCRAISEAVQSRLTYVAGSRDDIRRAEYADTRSEDDLRELESQLADPAPTLAFASRASLATATFEDDIAVLLEALRRAGIESAAVVDLTRPGIDIPVVKVIVPGLEDATSPSYLPGKRAAAVEQSR